MTVGAPSSCTAAASARKETLVYCSGPCKHQVSGASSPIYPTVPSPDCVVCECSASQLISILEDDSLVREVWSSLCIFVLAGKRKAHQTYMELANIGYIIHIQNKS